MWTINTWYKPPHFTRKSTTDGATNTGVRPGESYDPVVQPLLNTDPVCHKGTNNFGFSRGVIVLLAKRKVLVIFNQIVRSRPRRKTPRILIPLKIRTLRISVARIHTVQGG